MRRQLIALAAVAAVAALAAACAPMAPERGTPPLPVADTWSQPPGAAAGRFESDWQRQVLDTELAALLQAALAGNRDLRVAAAHIAQARAQVQARAADRFPTLNAAFAGQRVPTGNGNGAETYSAGLATSAWEIDVWNRIGSLRDAAQAQYLATAEARDAVQVALVANVASTWLALRAGNELLDLARRTQATRADSQRLARLRNDLGVASELDVRQADSLVEQARATVAQLERQRAQDENLLVLLLGGPLPDSVRAGLATGRLPAASPLAPVPAGLPSDVLAQRPDVRQAEQQLAVADANIAAARAAYFPRISLTAAYGSASPELSRLFAGGTWGWTLAPQVLLPLFDAGRNRANFDAGVAAREAAVAQYERSIQSAFREVNDALAGQATLGEQIDALQRQQAAEQARYDLSELRYRGGVASFLDALDAQRALFAVQQQVVQARLAQWQNQVQLYRALGGGWGSARGAAEGAAPVTP